MTHRAPSHGGQRALSQSDAIPQADLDEITGQIEILSLRPPVPASEMTAADLSDLLASFEADLCRLNKSLSKATRTSKSTIREFNDERRMTTGVVTDLNTELNGIRRR